MENSVNHPDNQENITAMDDRRRTTDPADQVIVVAVPLPAQGHINQMLQLSSLIASYGIPVKYIGSAIHNRQAKLRCAVALRPQDISRINFHDIQSPPIPSPPPNPNAPTKFPVQLQPAFDATLRMRQVVAVYLQELSTKFRRVVVIHDPAMSVVVQDAASLANAELYVFNGLAAFFIASFNWKTLGKESKVRHHWEGLPSVEETASPEAVYFNMLQVEALQLRSGDIFNTCRVMEAEYLDLLENLEDVENRKLWAVGPILPVGISRTETHNRYECLEWLDRQEPKSVIYVSFGTTVSLSDSEIKEIAKGLEDSKVKFVWVLRDADKGNIFDGEGRRAELPEGFQERTKGVGIVVRSWAPQLEILGHPSTGGFMSHCGWNSCIESISKGIPILAWPMHSDQPMNAWLVTQGLRTGILLKEWSAKMEVVKASSVESGLKRLMMSEQGEEIRRRAEELGENVRAAIQPGGASRLELDSFIAHITR